MTGVLYAGARTKGTRWGTLLSTCKFGGTAGWEESEDHTALQDEFCGEVA